MLNLIKRKYSYQKSEMKTKNDEHICSVRKKFEEKSYLLQLFISIHGGFNIKLEGSYMLCCVKLFIHVQLKVIDYPL